MADLIKKITSEPAIILIILTSLTLFKTTFEQEVGTEIITIYLTMVVLDGFLYLFDYLGIIRSDVGAISGNSTRSLLYAGGAIIGFALLYNLVNTLFRQSVLPISASEVELQQSVFQSAFGALVKFSSVDFSQITAIKYYLFGVLIPLIETRVISRLYGALAWMTNISITNLRNPRTHGLIIIISTLFMFFHLKVRGVNNNIDLVMTFLFAYISLILVSIFKEMEAANEFHVGTNMLALAYGR